MASRQRQRRASLTAYLNSPTKWSSREVSLPSLPSADLRLAFNAQKYTPDNNDVLEFIGDRVVNLVCALMAEKVKQIPDEQAWLARRLSNNDTLGRIAYQLRLHRHARLDRADRLAADSWTTARANPPPKLFADLFESYVGALYTHHGWTFTYTWLRKVYTPVLAAAARDVFFSTNDHVVPIRWLTPDALPWPCSMQRAFEAFMESRRERLRKGADEAFQSLPRVCVGEDAEATSVEIATQLLKLWVCDIAQRAFPELRSATQGGAHFLTMITNALMSDDTLGHLSALLSLSACLPPSDPDFLSSPARLRRVSSNTADRSCSTTRDAVRARAEAQKGLPAGPRVVRLDSGMEKNAPPDMAYRAKLARVLKARIGTFCLRHPVQGRKWGRAWITPLVQWAMDALLARDGGRMRRRWKPTTNLQAPTSKDLRSCQDKMDSGQKNVEDESERSLNALLNAFNDLDVGTARRRSNGGSAAESTLEPKSETDDEAKDDAAGSKPIDSGTLPSASRPWRKNSSKSKKPRTIKIKLGARWTVASDTTADGSANAETDTDTDALDPYRLLDESGAFPASLACDSLSEANDSDTSLGRAPERVDDPCWNIDKSDSGTDMEFSPSEEESGSDMEFSPSEEESGSDMEFSSSEAEEGDALTSAPEGAAFAAVQTGAEDDAPSEALLRSLARLNLGPIAKPTASQESILVRRTSESVSSASSVDGDTISSEALPLGSQNTNIPNLDVKFRMRKVTRPTHLRIKALDIGLDVKAEEAATKE